MELRPQVRVITHPGEIHQGQMFSIQAVVFDRKTQMRMPFDKIYLQIIDDKGVEIWPVSTVAEDTHRIDKLISTAQMRPGRYVVRVSPSKKLSPMGVAEFTVKRTISMAAIPLIPAAILAKNSSTKKEKIEADFLELRPPKITWLLYQTEKDSRVCPICINHDGKVFRPDDPKLIRIGPPETNGDTHWGCRCHYDHITEEMERIIAQTQFNAQYETVLEYAEIAEIAMIAMKQMPRFRN